MPGSSTSYLLSAIVFNPVFILHLVNTAISYHLPLNPNYDPSSRSPKPLLESLGPVRGTDFYFDVHDNDGACWAYTFFMVIVQLLALGRLQENPGNERATKTELERDDERVLDGSRSGNAQGQNNVDGVRNGAKSG